MKGGGTFVAKQMAGIGLSFGFLFYEEAVTNSLKCQMRWEYQLKLETGKEFWIQLWLMKDTIPEPAW